jgi:hypothetical protein
MDIRLSKLPDDLLDKPILALKVLQEPSKHHKSILVLFQGGIMASLKIDDVRDEY